ncbi:MAG: UDP-N-acetylmuramoyl-L-alanine--D-glutamate ligase [Clostridia bacterium]|nr:UDP-N-acetylmuramoyl-L-alanine--D-glutamate ligase [Clostridia bacterium]
MYFKGQKFFVAGLSVSGESSARFLLERGAEVYLYDDVVSENISKVFSELQALGAHIVNAESLDAAILKSDILVLSPGIPIDTMLPVTFRKQGKSIIGEEELAAAYLRATSVAVTGTNGKTTTVTMLNEMLNATGVHSVACGNNGNPLIKEVEDLTFKDYAVLEISSFQLETLTSLRPHIAVVTNITEDHLNRHYNMENYIFLKSKILRNLRESEFAVLNYDDPIVRGFAKNTKAKVIYFSMQGRVDGAYFENGGLYYNGEKYLDVSELTISGVHNVYNALACVAVAGVLGVDKKKASAAICAFKGIRHRVEKIREVNGVTYIDDSKGTNIDATIKAAQSMNGPTVILLGGKDKGEDYVPLFEGLTSTPVIHAVIYGENRFKMMNAAVRAGFLSFSLCSEFKTAVRIAEYIAKPGQRVLLSPASASFDSFTNYEERGDAFKELVEKINEVAD